MAHMESMGNSFLCKRCDPLIQRQMSWVELVEHFMKEEQWYDGAVTQRERLASYKGGMDFDLVNDHKLADPNALAAMHANEVESNVEQADDNQKKLNCFYCYQLGIYLKFPESHFNGHLRAKHRTTRAEYTDTVASQMAGSPHMQGQMYWK